MAERIIYLEDVDPVLFLGPGNLLLDKIVNLFPKIKIIARGNELKCVGEDEDLEIFINKMGELLAYYRKYNRINEEDIEKYLFDEKHMRSASVGDFEQPLIYGSSGKPVRARTVNQSRLVKDYGNNVYSNCPGGKSSEESGGKEDNSYPPGS
jgi:phosphate starvation-inducible protein PhoH and related proteins